MDMSIVQEIEVIDRKHELIIHGSLWRAIWEVSWPLFLNMVTISTVVIVEIWIAGRLGYETQAAVGFGFQIWNLMMMLATAMSAASTALVSRFWGAGDREQAIEAARQSLLLAMIGGILTTLVGLLAAKPCLSLLGATTSVESLAWDYLKIELCSQIGWNLIWVGNSIFRAKGTTHVPMFTWFVLTTTLVTFDWLLCLYPFHCGIAGLAWSSVIASTLGGGLNLYKLSKSDIGECLLLKGHVSLEKCRQWGRRLLSIGLPACIQNLSWLAGNFFFLYVFAQTAHAAACQAAWTVGFRVEETFAFLPVNSLGMAVATIVGQNLGAKLPKRAIHAGWQVAGIGFIINAIVGCLMFVFAKDIACAMTPDDRLVIDYTSQYLRIMGMCVPFSALWAILFGAMQGAGYTRWTMWATTIAMLAIRLPLAWVLTVTMKLAPLGAWLAIALTMIFLGSLGVWEFYIGKWKYQTV
jgi:putative MATE family efflux protein